MNTHIPETESENCLEPRIIFSGTAIVFRRQVRGRRLGLELLRALGLLLPFLTLGEEVLRRFLGDAIVSDGLLGFFKSNWTISEAILAAFLVPFAGAILGANAAPVRAERDSVQAMLLTQLTAWDVVTGRLLAALRTPICLLCISLVTCLAAQYGFRFLRGDVGNRIVSLVAVHGVLLAALLVSGATALLFALGSRPGRSWERGMLLSLSVSFLSIFALFALNGPIRRMANPKPLIESVLLTNPVIGVCTALHKDILRITWIYNRTVAPEYLFLYPSPLATTGVLMLIALAALVTSAIRLGRTYRGDY